ncbi:hypothetical protein GCM10009823_33740 [Brevibacterium salitolerans]|uniref:Uncharacterized protein n=1 Tax=Brevibacterium salitolerans TaxID=1403566 RepID=A0ABN2XBH5_9MICO
MVEVLPFRSQVRDEVLERPHRAYIEPNALNRVRIPLEAGTWLSFHCAETGSKARTYGRASRMG